MSVFCKFNVKYYRRCIPSIHFVQTQCSATSAVTTGQSYPHNNHRSCVYTNWYRNRNHYNYRMNSTVWFGLLSLCCSFGISYNHFGSEASSESTILELLHDHETPDVDIIFIHGLNGDKQETWKNKENETLFFDLVHNDEELKHINKRIWSFGYPNSIFSGGKQQPMRLENMGNNFFSHLYHSKMATSNTPIIFITHSMGGLVAKSAIVQSADSNNNQFYGDMFALHQRIRGIVFYGVPHKGSDVADLLELLIGNYSMSWFNPLSWISSLFGCNPSISIEELSASNTDLLNLQKHFFRWAGNEDREVNILSFIEQRKEKYLNKMVVKEDSARILLPREEPIFLPFSHSGVCKPDSYDDLRYIPIRKYLSKLVLDFNNEISEVNTITKMRPLNDALEQKEKPQTVSWQICAAQDVLSKALTHAVQYTIQHRKHHGTQQRGQKEAIVAFCYEIHENVTEFLSDCPDSREKGILMSIAKQIKSRADWGMREGIQSDAATNEICDNLRSLVLSAGKELDFDVEQPAVKGGPLIEEIDGFFLVEQKEESQILPWQIYAVQRVLSRALTHEIYTNRVHHPALERGQKEAMVAYCYEIHDVVTELLSDCSDSREKGILTATVKQIKSRANYGLRAGPSPDAARNEICDNLRSLILSAGKELDFDVEQPAVTWFHESVPGVDKSGYGSSLSGRFKYYAEGKGKGGGYLHKIVEDALKNVAPTLLK